MTGPRAKQWTAPPVWWDQAACRGMATSAFFSEGQEPPVRVRALCFGCPIRWRCLAESLDETYGFWGGIGPTQRRYLTKAQRVEIRSNAVLEDRGEPVNPLPAGRSKMADPSKVLADAARYHRRIVQEWVVGPREPA